MYISLHSSPPSTSSLFTQTNVVLILNLLLISQRFMFFLFYLFSHWINLPAKRGAGLWFTHLMRRCFKSSHDNLSIRLPAPFMLFQTVPKLPPEPGTHPVLEKQFFWLIYLTCTRKRFEISRLWFPCFFSCRASVSNLSPEGLKSQSEIQLKFVPVMP